MQTARQARDEWLALRCQAGDPGAFEDLCAEIEQPLLYYALKLVGNQETALDILQETWVRALRGIGKLRKADSVRSWLYSLVHGIAIDHPARPNPAAGRGDSRRGGKAPERATSAPPTPAPCTRRSDRISQIHREVLVLHFLEDFSLAEISAIVGCPEGTVKSRMHHAKAEIKAILSRGGYVRS